MTGAVRVDGALPGAWYRTAKGTRVRVIGATSDPAWWDVEVEGGSRQPMPATMHLFDGGVDVQRFVGMEIGPLRAAMADLSDAELAELPNADTRLVVVLAVDEERKRRAGSWCPICTMPQRLVPGTAPGTEQLFVFAQHLNQAARPCDGIGRTPEQAGQMVAGSDGEGDRLGRELWGDRWGQPRGLVEVAQAFNAEQAARARRFLDEPALGALPAGLGRAIQVVDGLWKTWLPVIERVRQADLTARLDLVAALDGGALPRIPDHFVGLRDAMRRAIETPPERPEALAAVGDRIAAREAGDHGGGPEPATGPAAVSASRAETDLRARLDRALGRELAAEDLDLLTRLLGTTRGCRVVLRDLDAEVRARLLPVALGFEEGDRARPTILAALRAPPTERKRRSKAAPEPEPYVLLDRIRAWLRDSDATTWPESIVVETDEDGNVPVEHAAVRILHTLLTETVWGGAPSGLRDMKPENGPDWVTTAGLFLDSELRGASSPAAMPRWRAILDEWRPRLVPPASVEPAATAAPPTVEPLPSEPPATTATPSDVAPTPTPEPMRGAPFDARTPKEEPRARAAADSIIRDELAAGRIKLPTLEDDPIVDLRRRVLAVRALGFTVHCSIEL